MKVHARFARGLAAASFALAAGAAQAGGPLSLCNFAPLKYPDAGTVNLNYDRGNLGTRTKAQADAIVTAGVALWTNVPTSSVTIGRGTDLPVDVTTANVATYLDHYEDGINPVVYDTDGSIIDQLMGVGAKNSVLGFAGSAWYGEPTCAYAEGEAVISGFLSVSDTTLSVVMAHEIGHLIGLDHTQLDSTQGLSPAAGTSNYPLMYPVAYRDFVSLHEDDVAAVSALYPHSTLSGVYGQISGTFMRADGVTPVRGANLWATETTTGKLYSVVSDYLTQGTGYFKLLLPAGTYTLRAEAIDSAFTEGSSVGPYAETAAGISFQSPLYSGSTPMAPVTLGNATPTAFSIAPGCTATLTFRINGTGTVGGNCGGVAPAPAVLASPAAGSTLAGATQTFTWNNSGASLYQVWVGNTYGSHDLGYYPNPATNATSVTISGLPTDGRMLYVRLYSSIGGVWYPRDYTYRAASLLTATPAVLASPAPGSTLPGSAQTFTWNNSGAGLYQVWVGNTYGSHDLGYYPNPATSGTSVTISGLPTDGRTLYVRLYSYIAGVWTPRDYTYRAFSSTVGTPASMMTPAAGSMLSGATQTFTWNNSGASAYQVWVGNTFGSYDLGYYPNPATSGTSVTISGLPTDGRTLYVRLYSNVGGTWQPRDYTYRAGP